MRQHFSFQLREPFVINLLTLASDPLSTVACLIVENYFYFRRQLVLHLNFY